MNYSIKVYVAGWSEAAQLHIFDQYSTQVSAQESIANAVSELTASAISDGMTIIDLVVHKL